MSQAKERPIPFGAPMVRALLDGRKTVTRRQIKHQPFDLSWSRRDHSFNYVSGRAANGDEVDGFWAYTTRSGGSWEAKCPYGQTGDRLWVREAWAADAQLDSIAPRELSQGEPIIYPADGSVRRTGCTMISRGRGRPSIHMPRWASRILLEITEVRVERLQDISEGRAEAEGVGFLRHVPDADETLTAAQLFECLWCSINGDESWNANPWVWVVEFKVVEPCA